MTPDPLFDFTDKVILVTGGSRGLGYQMVKAFAERGADVIVASRKIGSCESAAEECRAMGRRALAFAAHVGKWTECDALIAAAYAEFGRVDVLVNNAGMSPPMPSHKVPEKLFDSVMNLNFKGPFRLASQIGKRMADGDGGAIINISSTGALMALAESARQHVFRRPVSDRYCRGLGSEKAGEAAGRARPSGQPGRNCHHRADAGQPRILLHQRCAGPRRRRPALVSFSAENLPVAGRQSLPPHQ